MKKNLPNKWSILIPTLENLVKKRQTNGSAYL